MSETKVISLGERAKDEEKPFLERFLQEGARKLLTGGYRTKGCGSRIATLTMVLKLGIKTQKHWRRLNGSELIPKVVTGVQFVDGEQLHEQTA